ncbi:excinuclease ABC subunit A [Shimia sp.]|uniref:excinuclease ABC subunit A n=1 Tax=Shimia sp. TaxID=1954381 RepID=UPI003BAD0388
MTQDRVITSLKCGCGLSIAMGLGALLALLTQSFGLLSWFSDLVHLPLDDQQRFSDKTDQVLAAIGGGVLVGLGVTLWQVITLVYVKDPQTGGKIISYGIWSWFVVDSLGSIAAGAWFNAVLNLGFLLMFILPLRLADTAHTPKAASRI